MDTKSYSILKSLFGARKTGVLATIDKLGKPYASLIAFSPSDDMREIYFTTRRNSHKFENILANPSVCMLIDDRKNSDDDIVAALSVSASGPAYEVSENERNSLIDSHSARHPSLKEFSHEPDIALVRIAVLKYYIISNFEDIFVCEIKR